MLEEIETISSMVLREHVERLTERGPRHRDNPAGVLAALDYIEQCLTSYGYQVEHERYGDARTRSTC